MRATIAAISLAAAACGAMTEPQAHLLTRATRDSIFVTNQGPETVNLLVVDVEELALMNMAACLTREQCGFPSLEPGATLQRSIASLDSSHDGVRDVLVTASIFRTVRPGVDSAFDAGSVHVEIPR